MHLPLFLKHSYVNVLYLIHNVYFNLYLYNRIMVFTVIIYFTFVVGTTTTHRIRITIKNKDVKDFNEAEKETFLKAVRNSFTYYSPDKFN